MTGLPWAEAADLLRRWEYTGRARRGYFVQGLSGDAYTYIYLRAQDYARVRHALDHPGAAALWLPAQDPGQAYGRALAHAAGREFTRAAGTAVCLLEGRAVAVLERQGEALRLLEPACADEALTRAGARFRRAPHPSASRPALHPRLSGGRGVRARAGGVCPPHARLRALSVGAAAPGIDFWPCAVLYFPRPQGTLTRERFAMKKRLSDLLLLTVGTLLVSAGVYFFKFPNNFSTGGVSGISVILGALLPGISTGTLVLVHQTWRCCWWGLRYSGRSFGLKTVYCSMLMSLSIYALERLVPMDAPLTTQPMLELVFSVLLPPWAARSCSTCRAARAVRTSSR